MRPTKIYNLKQEWTQEFLAQIRERDLIFYHGKGNYAIRLHPAKGIPEFEILSVHDWIIETIPNNISYTIQEKDQEYINRCLLEAKTYWHKLQTA